MVLRVELLHACLNTSPVLDEVLKSLSLLPEGLEDAGCVVSPTRQAAPPLAEINDLKDRRRLPGWRLQPRGSRKVRTTFREHPRPP